MSKRLNLTGLMFGSYTVLAPAKSRGSTRNRTFWLCRCNCGVEKEVETQNLTRSPNISCGGHKYKDITGHRFGKLVALHVVPNHTKYTGKIWLCLCDCGGFKEVPYGSLNKGNTQSCGCTKINLVGKQIIGQTFGRLTVLNAVWSDTWSRVKYNCICSCGNNHITDSTSLVCGHTKSCGCISAERRGENHQNWNPELTIEDRVSNRQYIGYKQWRGGVYTRDKYTCQACGDSRGGNLVAHHMYSYRAYPELRTTLNNGVTLCTTCHKLFHSTYGYKNNTKEQYLNFLDFL